MRRRQGQVVTGSIRSTGVQSNPRGVEHYHRSLNQGLYNAEFLREVIEFGGVPLAMRHSSVDSCAPSRPRAQRRSAPDNAIISGAGADTVPPAHVYVFTQMMGDTHVASRCCTRRCAHWRTATHCGRGGEHRRRDPELYAIVNRAADRTCSRKWCRSTTSSGCSLGRCLRTYCAMHSPTRATSHPSNDPHRATGTGETRRPGEGWAAEGPRKRATTSPTQPRIGNESAQQPSTPARRSDRPEPTPPAAIRTTRPDQRQKRRRVSRRHACESTCDRT